MKFEEILGFKIGNKAFKYANQKGMLKKSAVIVTDIQNVRDRINGEVYYVIYFQRTSNIDKISINRKYHTGTWRLYYTGDWHLLNDLKYVLLPYEDDNKAIDMLLEKQNEILNKEINIINERKKYIQYLNNLKSSTIKWGE